MRLMAAKEKITMRMALAAAVIASLMSTTAIATDYKVGSIEIMNPWTRVNPKGSKDGVGYMTIKNNGTTPDRLIGGTVDAAGGVELHSMLMEDGGAKMRELKDIEIKPGQTIEFKPSGSHAMFVGLKRPLSKGEHIKGTLAFEHAGTVEIEYPVEGLGAKSGPMDHMQH
jgi:periplasmic copper chaperone A